jgi:hypothetical protein
MCGLVVKASSVDRQTLHQEGGSPANRISPVLGQLFQEFLVTE